MGYPNRPDWNALCLGATVWPVLLIAGVPFAFIPSGSPLVNIRWSGAHYDPAFWPAPGLGTFSGIAVKPWLETRAGFNTGFTSHGADGTVDVAVPAISLLDNGYDGGSLPYLTGASATALFGSSDSAPTTTLTATMGPTDVTMFVAATAPFGSPTDVIVVWVGIEAIIGTIVDSVTIGSLSRGVYGSLPSVHVAQSGNTNARVYGAIPALNGRRATLFYVQQDPADPTGATGLDPEMRFDGVVRPGGGADGATWKMNLAPWVRKPENRSNVPLGQYAVSGIVHYNPTTDRGSTITYPNPVGPLATYWNYVSMCLTTDVPGSVVNAGGTDYDNGGWHADAASFIADWNRQSSALSYPDSGSAQALLDASGRVYIAAHSSSSDTFLLVTTFQWDPFYNPDSSSTTANASFRSSKPFPNTFQRLDQWLYLSAADASQIPATPAPFMSSFGETQIYWTLSAQSSSPPVTAMVVSIETRGAMSIVYMRPTVLAVLAGVNTIVNAGTATDFLITDATTVTLGAFISAATWWDGLRALAIALQSVPGADVIADSYDWDDISAQGISAATASSPFYVNRNGPVDISVPFIDLFSQEVRLAGGVVVVRFGRISWRTFSNVSVVSPVVAVLSKQKSRMGIVPTVSDARDRVVASYAATASDGSIYSVVDQNAANESGGTYSAWEVNIPPSAWAVIPQPITSAWVTGFTSFGLATIAPWRRSYRVMKFSGTPALLTATVGDVVSIPDDWIVPNNAGSRGFSGVGQIMAADERMFGEDTGVDLTIKLTTTAYVSPYAPECLIAPGGINTTTGVLTIDDTTFGLDGFGLPGSAHGGADSFHVGDVVELIQVGVATPASPFTTVVSAVDTATIPPTITVIPKPNSTWAGYTTLGAPTFVMLTYRDYASATNTWPADLPQPPGTQHDYAFIADYTTGLLDTGVYPDRWQ